MLQEIKNFLFNRKHLLIIIAAIVVAILGTLLIIFAPWYLDFTGPIVRIIGIQENNIYNKTITIYIIVQDSDNQVRNVEIAVDDFVHYNLFFNASIIKKQITFNTNDFSDGIHTLIVTTNDTALFCNSTIEQIQFTIDTTAPQISLEPFVEQVFQGDTLPVFVKSDENLSFIQGEVFGRKVTFYQSKQHPQKYRGLVGIYMLAELVPYTLSITTIDSVGNEITTQFNIQVLGKAFRKDVINLPEKKVGLLSDTEAINLDYYKIDTAFSQKTELQYWQGPFLRPVDGLISSYFGDQRVYNNGIIANCHQGIDVAHEAGTPIKTANKGQVVLAERLHLYGITVIIDHGQGVLTMYCHMNERLVSENDRVEKGQHIGYIGDTGVSTAPHLHWEMRVENMPVDPFQWEKESFDF